MKKMIVTIIVLFIIFVSLLIYRTNEKGSEVKVEEISQIESYLEKIYGWKEITNEALPEFQKINEANEKWIWGTVRENIDDFEIEYETIEKVAKELYGNEFSKHFPKEGNEFITYDTEKQKYIVKEITLDAIKDTFLLNKIEKNFNEYNIEIVEYLVDFTQTETGKVYIKNINEEIIYELTEETATEGNIKKVVKENMDKFNKKIVTLEKEEEKIIIQTVKEK